MKKKDIFEGMMEDIEAAIEDFDAGRVNRAGVYALIVIARALVILAKDVHALIVEGFPVVRGDW